MTHVRVSVIRSDLESAPMGEPCDSVSHMMLEKMQAQLQQHAVSLQRAMLAMAGSRRKVKYTSRPRH